MIRRRSRIVYRWLNGHPFVAALIMIVAVAAPGYLALQRQADDIAAIAQCGQDYTEATNAAAKPIREAAKKLDAADDVVWQAVSRIFTQRASQADYDALRRAVRERNRLSDRLARARAEHPIPPPPETFC